MAISPVALILLGLTAILGVAFMSWHRRHFGR